MSFTLVDSQALLVTLLVVHCIGILMASYRIFFGNDLANLLTAVEYIAVNILSIITIYCIFAKDAVYLDIAIVLGLIGFLGTVALSRYIELSARQQGSAKRNIKESE